MLAADNAKNQPNPAGGESPVKPAPPVPGQQTVPAGQEQPIAPAPAIPTGGAQQAGAVPQERVIRPAPIIPSGGSQEQQISGPGALPTAGPSGGSTGEHPLTSAPQVPMPGPQQTTPAGPAPQFGQAPMAGPPAAVPQQPGYVGGETPMAQAPTAGMPAQGQMPMQPGQPGYPQPPYGTGQAYPAAPVGAQGEMPMANPGMMPGTGYPAPMAPTGPGGMPAPGWGQPPSTPPPVPPPNEPQAPHQQVNPVGNVPSQPQPSGMGTAVTPAASGETPVRSAKTSTARSLRRRSRERSWNNAMMFVCGAALFLVFVVIIAIVSLM